MWPEIGKVTAHTPRGVEVVIHTPDLPCKEIIELRIPAYDNARTEVRITQRKPIAAEYMFPGVSPVDYTGLRLKESVSEITARFSNEGYKVPPVRRQGWLASKFEHIFGMKFD